jgi:hypothetical protein
MAKQYQPQNTNFLSQLGFRFVIKKLPSVNFFVQSISIPSISVAEVEIGTPFARIPFPGDRLSFDDLSFTFRVDEDFNNYLELFNWMKSFARVDDIEETKTAWQNEKGSPMSDTKVFSDATLLVNNSAMNSNIEVKFVDLYPYSMGELQFTTTGSDVEYIECTVGCKYRKFDITKL